MFSLPIGVPSDQWNSANETMSAITQSANSPNSESGPKILKKMLPQAPPLEPVGDVNPHVPKHPVIVSRRPKFSRRPAGKHHRLEGVEQHHKHDHDAEDRGDESHRD